MGKEDKSKGEDITGIQEEVGNCLDISSGSSCNVS